ncbi:phosphomannomutase [Shewanella sp. SR44-3]|uniref:phosphomannomutase n=1 Tax=Shewanella sp. SR44-3 TaxID=2760936 RepID=UPI0015FA78A9|nr:phosphomannomutase [Shewanella sp. SR44-3]MBB1269297.1 phosphomannomutase [Shewanella sp. SR44-3]
MLTSHLVLANSGVAFGTSGARGLVTDFTADVCAAFTLSFLAVMKSSFKVNTIALAIDNRPSSINMAKACVSAANLIGIEVIYYGVLPTPALAFKSMALAIPAIMVTGSHIPFDRNGLKFYRPDGEITKADELAILSTETAFSPLTDLADLTVDASAATDYCLRYVSLFDKDLLKGKHIGIYEHSSAGRDLYAALFQSLGAQVTSLERSDEFVPIDTEAVSDDDVRKALLWSKEFGFDAIFSTDGDGDRPLIADENGQWLRGDILGLLCAQSLGIEALAVPVSCNTAIEASGYFKNVSRTKIGSPYVIAEFDKLKQKYQRVAGFEANGGFLLGSNIMVKGKPLTALPTRDAVLPVLAVLALSKTTGIAAQVANLPQRYTHSDRLKDFPTDKSKAIIARVHASPQELLTILGVNADKLVNVNATDGLRLTLASGLIIHLRPSGNAPEFRCYVEAESVLESRRFVCKALKALESIKLNV